MYITVYLALFRVKLLYLAKSEIGHKILYSLLNLKFVILTQEPAKLNLYNWFDFKLQYYELKNRLTLQFVLPDQQ
jgi:hypothetical protein